MHERETCNTPILTICSMMRGVRKRRAMLVMLTRGHLSGGSARRALTSLAERRRRVRKSMSA